MLMKAILCISFDIRLPLIIIVLYPVLFLHIALAHCIMHFSVCFVILFTIGGQLRWAYAFFQQHAMFSYIYLVVMFSCCFISVSYHFCSFVLQNKISSY